MMSSLCLVLQTAFRVIDAAMDDGSQSILLLLQNWSELPEQKDKNNFFIYQLPGGPTKIMQVQVKAETKRSIVISRH